MSDHSIHLISTPLQRGGKGRAASQPFNGLAKRGKPLKRFLASLATGTGLKPGV